MEKRGGGGGGRGGDAHFTRKIPKFLAQMGVKVTETGSTNAQDLADKSNVVREREDREDNEDELPVVVEEGTGREQQQQDEGVSAAVGAPGDDSDEVLMPKDRRKDKRRRVVVAAVDEERDVGPQPGPAKKGAIVPPTRRVSKPILSFDDL